MRLQACQGARRDPAQIWCRQGQGKKSEQGNAGAVAGLGAMAKGHMHACGNWRHAEGQRTAAEESPALLPSAHCLAALGEWMREEPQALMRS